MQGVFLRLRHCLVNYPVKVRSFLPVFGDIIFLVKQSGYIVVLVVNRIILVFTAYVYLKGDCLFLLSCICHAVSAVHIKRQSKIGYLLSYHRLPALLRNKRHIVIRVLVCLFRCFFACVKLYVNTFFLSCFFLLQSLGFLLFSFGSECFLLFLSFLGSLS